jgi:hypothetical protein
MGRSLADAAGEGRDGQMAQEGMRRGLCLRRAGCFVLRLSGPLSTTPDRIPVGLP